LVQTFRFDTLSTAKKRKKMRGGLFAIIFLPANADALYVNFRAESETTTSSLIVSTDAEIFATTDVFSFLADARTELPLRITLRPAGMNSNAIERVHLRWAIDISPEAGNYVR
jgi:hypothetical protein